MEKESKRTEEKWIKRGNFIYMLDSDSGFNRYTFLVKACNGLHTQVEEQDMADYVFKAVNNHDGLVEVLEKAIDGLKGIDDIINIPSIYPLRDKLDLINNLTYATLEALKEVEGN